MLLLLTGWPVSIPGVARAHGPADPSAGTPFILQALIWYKLDGPAQTFAYLADAQTKLLGQTLF
jgi:hypothetical protein